MSEAWTIKPLEWRTISESSTWVYCEAQSPIGLIVVEGYPHAEFWYRHGVTTRMCGFDTIEAAKAAASQWYRDRLLSALAPATDVIEECRKTLRLVESMFKRQAACPVSSEHLGDDEHEAWTATTAAIAKLDAMANQ